MHDGASGKVNGTHLLQETSAPDPVCHRHVDQDAPKYGEQEETGELHTLGKRTQNQSRRDDGKHALEEHEQQFGYASGGECLRSNAREEHFVKSANDSSQRISTVHQPRAEDEAVAEGDPKHAHRTHDEQALHDNAEYVFLTHQAAIEEGDARNSHQQDEDGGNNNPCSVAAVE